MKPTGRFAVPDTVRTICIIVVVVGHAFATGLWAGHGYLGGLLGRVQDNSAYAVTVFLVASGFIITQTLLHDDGAVSTAHFYRRRFARLGPLAIAVLAVAAALSSTLPRTPQTNFVLHTAGANFSWWMILSYPGLLFNWARIANAHHTFGWGLEWDIFWSLAIEEQFYILYPRFLRWSQNRQKLIPGTLFSVVLLGLLFRELASHMAPSNFLLTFTASPAGFDAIALGVLANFVARNRRLRSLSSLFRGSGVLVASAVAVWVFLSTNIVASPSDRAIGPTVLGLSTAVVLALAGTSALSLQKPITRPGELCYGIYLLHPFAILLVWPLLPHTSAWLGITIVVAVVLASAEVSFRCLERPAARALRSPRRQARKQEMMFAPQPRDVEVSGS